MSQNFATVKSITDNLQSVLSLQGIKFSRKTFVGEKSIPASLIPFGEVYYQGEGFEYTHGQRQGYAEIHYLIKVVLQERDPANLMSSTQKWVHSVKDVLTVNALNVGDLAASKLVSLVTIDSVETVYKAEYGVLDFKVKVRYREM